MGNSPSQEDAETVSKFNQVQRQADPWTSRSADALNIVNDDDCAICAAAASQIYYGESRFFDFMEDALGQKGLTILRKAFFDGKLDEDHTEETHPPMASIIFRLPGSSETTLLLVFRGSTTGSDWTANADASPIPSPLWSNEWPHIKVHKGWGGEIWRYFSDYCGLHVDGSPRQRPDGGDRVPDLVKEFNITKILFSGHSLGGALAQIASMGGMLVDRKIRELDDKIPKIQMRTFTFAAPMPVYFKDKELNDEERHALNQIRRTSYNVVFDLDVVPHIPGHHRWIKRLSSDFKEAADNAAKSFVPAFVPWSVVKAYVQPYTEIIAQSSAKRAEHFKNYKHVSMIVHFDLYHAESLVGFTAFSIKIITPEQFEQLDYPFPASKNGRFKALLGLPAHSCVPETIVYGSFDHFPSMPQEMDNSMDVKDDHEEGEILVDDEAEQVNNDDEKKEIEPQACSDVSQVADDAMPARKSCSDSLIPDGTKVLQDSGGLSDDVRDPAMAVSVDGRRCHGWTATSSAWAVGLFVLILFVMSRSKVGSPLLVIGGKDWLSRLKSTLSKGGVKDAKEEMLFIIGGTDGRSILNSVEDLNIIKGASFLSTKSSMQQKRYGHYAAVIDGQAYVAGGLKGTSYLGSVERYDPKVGKWILLRGKMNTPRSQCAAAAVDGRLYVMGGTDARGNYLDSVEMFDPNSESWSTVAKMGSKRWGCAAVSLGGKVFVMGGSDGSWWKSAVNSGEVFDPIKDEWSPLPATMNTKRTYCAAAVLGDKIYVAGGFDGSSYLNSVEVYDPGAGRWSLLSTPMNTERYGCAAAVMGGKLFVAGGYNGSDGDLDSVEVYDPATERWTMMIMKNRRNGCAAVVV